MKSAEYAEYLLKNHRVIKKELEILTMDIESRKKRQAAGQATGKNSNVLKVVRENRSIMPDEDAAHAAYLAQIELNKLEVAIGTLDKNEKDVIVDLYIYKLNWEIICQKHYISANTLNRRRKKGINFIAQAMECDRLKGLLSACPRKEE